MRDKLLTRAEARAVQDLLNFGWADYEALGDGEMQAFKFGKRWLAAARRGTKKIRSRAARERQVEEKKP